jgi:hypothetical protein
MEKRRESCSERLPDHYARLTKRDGMIMDYHRELNLLLGLNDSMDLVKHYSNFNLRLTPQRMAIFDYLKGNKTHPSAEDIYRAVSRRFPTMALATVYNTLAALKRRGQLLEA